MREARWQPEDRPTRRRGSDAHQRFDPLARRDVVELVEVAKGRVPGDRLANSHRRGRLLGYEWLHGLRLGGLLGCRWLDRLWCWRGGRRDGLDSLVGLHHLWRGGRSLWCVIGLVGRDGVGLLRFGGE